VSRSFLRKLAAKASTSISLSMARRQMEIPMKPLTPALSTRAIRPEVTNTATTGA